MAASAQVADLQVIAVLFNTSTWRSYMCMTDSARDKDEVTKDKKVTICLKPEEVRHPSVIWQLTFQRITW